MAKHPADHGQPMCEHGLERDFCSIPHRPQPKLILTAKTKPRINLHWLAEQLGASEVVQLPASVSGDPTGRAAYDFLMESRGFKQVG